MPQMAPMSWLMIFLFTSLSMVCVIVSIHYLKLVKYSTNQPKDLNSESSSPMLRM